MSPLKEKEWRCQLNVSLATDSLHNLDIQVVIKCLESMQKAPDQLGLLLQPQQPPPRKQSHRYCHPVERSTIMDTPSMSPPRNLSPCAGFLQDPFENGHTASTLEQLGLDHFTARSHPLVKCFLQGNLASRELYLIKSFQPKDITSRPIIHLRA
ncbi:hypothetical protein GBF38_017777 [Nibea albiflora]|uniref:Uncharacterized protein n=1 Tax=Nibea albiflora TaxID=240163 RepID=A0ACB7F5M8_NIBAL|nr:hypothetical protein GBF38_017777 [Nibea albiflora]